MTSPIDPPRAGSPTVAEIAALTARLRELTARGRDVDPAERAAFLTDKGALITRITDTHPDVRGGGPRSDEPPARADGARVGEIQEGWLVDPAVAAGHPDDDAVAAGQTAAQEAVLDAYYTADIGTDDEVVGDVWEREFDALCERYPLPGDPGGAELEIGVHGQAYWEEYGTVDDDCDEVRPVDEGWWTRNTQQGTTVDTAHHQITDAPAGDGGGQVAPWPVMPEWMAEQARSTEAEIAAGTYVPAAPDDPAQIAARIAELREQVAAHGPQAEAEERREQLNRWHADDTATDADARTDGNGFDVPVIVTDDGPGLP